MAKAKQAILSLVTSEEPIEVPSEVIEATDQAETRARAVVVVTEEQYRDAGATLIDIDSTIKTITETRLSFTRPLDALKKQWMDRFRDPLDRLETAKKQIKDAMLAFRRVQELEAQRIRASQEAEQKRLEAEAEAKRIADWEDALAAGDTHEAEAIIQSVPIVPALPIEPPAPPVASGIAVRKVWRFRIVNEADIPRAYMIPNERLLADIAGAQKQDANVPGVEFYADEVISRTGR